MKRFAIVALVLAFALPASAGVVHNEAVDGDLSSNPAAPTPLAFALGGNTVIGTTTSGDRDYFRFTIPANQALVALNLLDYSPDNLSFAAFNAGTTSYVPGASTNALFLAGIHVSLGNLGTDLLPLFVCCAVTTNALPSPQLGPGDYCFVIQQTNAIVTTYALEFVLQGNVSTESSTWGAIKALYR